MKNARLFLMILCCFPCLASSSELIRIMDVLSESDKEATLISAMFKGKTTIEPLAAEAHGTFIQIKVPGAMAVESGKFYDASGPYFRKIAIFQIDSDSVGIRLFATQETSTLTESISTEVLKDRILIHLNHGTIASNSESPKISAENHVEAGKNTIPSNDAINDLPKSSVNKGDIQDKLMYTTVISGVLIIFLLVSLSYKKLIGKVKGGGSDIISSPMKTLATHALAPKHSLTLVEVSSQKILLSVSPDGINYLTTIEKPEVQRPVHTTPREMPVLSHSPQVSSRKNKVELKTSPQKETRKPTNNIAERILDKKNSEDGVKTSIESNKQDSQRTIEDVTKLIRSKLKDLPSV